MISREPLDCCFDRKICESRGVRAKPVPRATEWLCLKIIREPRYSGSPRGLPVHAVTAGGRAPGGGGGGGGGNGGGGGLVLDDDVVAGASVEDVKAGAADQDVIAVA